MDPVTVTITATDNGFTVEHNGESETFDSVDRALQEARGYLTGMDEGSEPGKEEMDERAQEEMDFTAGFRKARGMPL